MHVPKRPPLTNFAEISSDPTFLLLTRDPALLQKMIAIGPLTEDGRYRHWDRLRRLAPPPGLTSEQWWFGLKMARIGILKPMPLRDREGAFFRVALPDPALDMTHTIDRDACGQIGSATEPITNTSSRDYYLIRSLMEEAITSSQLEGAATTRKVAKEMLRTGRAPRNKDEQMISSAW